MYILNVYKWMYPVNIDDITVNPFVNALTVAFSNDIPTSFWTVYTPDLHRRGLVDFSPVAPEKRKSFQITKRSKFS